MRFLNLFKPGSTKPRLRLLTNKGPMNGCGGLINLTSASMIRSLDVDGDGHYEDNLDCIWIIVAPEDKVIRIEFANFSLEASPTGCYDVLEVPAKPEFNLWITLIVRHFIFASFNSIFRLSLYSACFSKHVSNLGLLRTIYSIFVLFVCGS